MGYRIQNSQNEAPFHGAMSSFVDLDLTVALCTLSQLSMLAHPELLLLDAYLLNHCRLDLRWTFYCVNVRRMDV